MVKEHSDRIEMGRNSPYFVKDNKKRVDRILAIEPPEVKKTIQEIAAERHANRDAVAIQQAWNERRIANIQQAAADGFIPDSWVKGLSKLSQDELNARIERLQKVVAQTKTNIPIMADKVLGLRTEYPYDVDFSSLEKFIAEGNLTKMQQEAKREGYRRKGHGRSVGRSSKTSDH